MPAKSEKPLEKVSLNLYKGDRETIEKHYPDAGYQSIIRHLAHQLARQLRNEEKEQSDERGRGKSPSD